MIVFTCEILTNNFITTYNEHFYEGCGISGCSLYSVENWTKFSQIKKK